MVQKIGSLFFVLPDSFLGTLRNRRTMIAR